METLQICLEFQSGVGGLGAGAGMGGHAPSWQGLPKGSATFPGASARLGPLTLEGGPGKGANGLPGRTFPWRWIWGTWVMK